MAWFHGQSRATLAICSVQADSDRPVWRLFEEFHLCVGTRLPFKKEVHGQATSQVVGVGVFARDKLSAKARRAIRS